MKKILSLVLFSAMFCLSSALPAQDRTITGKVTDGKEGVPGATVIVKGTNQGAAADIEGNYSLSNVSSGAVLVFSAVGFTAKEVTVGASNVINVTLAADAIMKEEVTVIGYGARNITGQVPKIKGEDIAKLPVTSFDQALVGKAPGLQVTPSSGIIGDDVIMRIRGAGSITSGTRPLIVIDGVPIIDGDQGQLYNRSNALQNINPADIEDYKVLKDASAAAIYGSRASNGVILITTKKGKVGKPVLSYQFLSGWNEPNNRLKVLNGDQYNSFINRSRVNAGLPLIANDIDLNGDGQPDRTDWQDLIYRKGFVMNHQFNVGGGTEKLRYSASAGYNEFNSHVIVNQLKRGNIRLNVDGDATDWLNVGLNAQYSRTFTRGLGSGVGGALSGPMAAYFLLPNVPAYGSDGFYYTGKGNNVLNLTTNWRHPVYVANENYDNLDSKRLLGNVFAEISFTKAKDLKFRTQYGIDYLTDFSYQYWNPAYGDGAGLGGVAQNVYNQILLWNWQSYITYNKRFNDIHDINFTGGVEYQKRETIFSYVAGIGASDPFFKKLIGGAWSDPSYDGDYIVNGFDSYFARVSYGFKDKYLLDLSLRSDGFSGYGENTKRALFPAASIAWRVSKEGFMEKQNVISDLKVRASWGLTGNSNIGSYTSRSLYAPAQYGDGLGLAASQPGNPELQWETSAQTDVGLDLSLFNNRLSLTFDYYDRRIRDAVLNVQVVGTSGLPTNAIGGVPVVPQNLGEMYNRGFEITLAGDIIRTKDFIWNANFNLTTNENKILALDALNRDIFDGLNIARVGEAIGSFYLIRWAGVDPATGHAQFLDKNGMLKRFNPATNSYFDENGNPTTPISAADRVVVGNSNPKLFGGFTNTLTYKNFDFSFLIQYAADYYVYNGTRATLERMTNENKAIEVLDAWTTPGQYTNQPRPRYNDRTSYQASTKYLEDAGFMRATNITFGYNFSKNMISRLSIAKLRVFAQVLNAFTITGYNGIAPDANANGQVNIAFGLDSLRPPLARSYNFGVNVEF